MLLEMLELSHQEVISMSAASGMQAASGRMDMRVSWLYTDACQMKREPALHPSNITHKACHPIMM